MSKLQKYDVEWTDNEGFDRVTVINAKTASDAWRKGNETLSKRSDFGSIFNVEPTD